MRGAGKAIGSARAAALLACVLGAVAGAVLALERIEITLQAVSGAGWSTGPVAVTLTLGADGELLAEATLDRLSLPAPLATLHAASLRCRGARWQGTVIACPDAVLSVAAASGTPVELRGELRLDTATQRVRLRLGEQPLLSGRIALTVDAAPSSTRLSADFSGLPGASVQQALASTGDAQPLAVSAGSVSGSLRFERTASRGRLDATLAVRGIAFSDPQSLHAGEALDADVTLRGSAAGERWSLEGSAAVTAGAAYLHPLLLEVGERAVTAEIAAVLAPGGRVTVERLALRDPRGAELAGQLDADLSGADARLLSMRLELAPAPAARLYDRYLKPFAGAGALADLLLQGRVSGAMHVDPDGRSRATLAIDAVDVGDDRGRFALLGLDGRIEWADGGGAPPSRLAWRSAQAWSLDFGPGRIAAELEGRGARLSEPLRVTLLDGALRVERLAASALGTAQQRLEADLTLEPLSLERLSDRLAWLPLAGSVEGSFSRLVYAGDRVAVEGDVRMRLFDGDVTLSSLSLEHPFGVVPRLRADIAIVDLDLGVLTRALSFGSIEGRLGGHVRDLVLEAWQPVAFDARLATPPGDRSRHRISQRAVDNLASLGGANAVLSSTFLRFFQEFSYERLGLSCRLRAGVCEMDGVGPADRGYYIVKGGGLPPRVDVVGFNRRVDWNTLLARLRAVASSSGPVVR